MKNLFNAMKPFVLIVSLCAFIISNTMAQTYWTPATGFGATMTGPAVLILNGTELRGTLIEVGAFCGAQCRSTAKLLHFPLTDRYFAPMNIGGNDGEIITFKVYDHETGIEYETEQMITFVTNASVATLDEPYEVFIYTTTVPPVITTTTLPNGKVEEEYEVTLSATGDTPITWTLASGSLPNGLTLSPAGVISGVPTLKGTYNFTVQAGNAAGNAVKALAITVDLQMKWISPSGVYSGSMTAFSYVTINGVDPESDYLEIGAFNGAECRGAGMINYYASLSGYYCFLMIYGDASFTITFKVYDHATDTEYDAENVEIYTTNAMLGAPPEPPYEIIVLAEITPTYSISLTPATNKDFGVEPVGYSALPAHGVTVSNAGNQPTGNLTVALSGANAGSFTLSKTTINSIAVDGDDSFTVVPNTGLDVGSYTATVTVSGDNDIMESFEVSFEVLAEAVPPVITTTTLPNGKVGDEYEVTLTATGNTPITWTLASGNLPNGLTLSPAGVISGVPTLKGSYSFTVQAGNAAGDAVKELTITVDLQMKWISPSGVYSGSMTAFSHVTINGVDPESDYIEIGAFNGTECRGAGMINYYDQLGYYCFLMIYGDASFTITFKVYDHATGTEYDAENVEIYTSNATLGLPPGPPYEIIVLTEASPTYGISLTPATNKNFGVETVGYSAHPAHSVTVSNTGNQPTGNLTVTLSGANAGSFTLSKTTISSIAVDGDDSFTVVPNTGLGVDSYTATVTVTGDNDIMESFEVSFEVEPKVGIEDDITGLQEISIYPNPTTGELRIRNYELGITNVEVLDVYGKKISSHHLIPSSSHHQIDVSYLAKGIYLLRINTNNREMISKFVKD